MMIHEQPPLQALLQELDDTTFEQLYQETLVFDETGILVSNSLIRTVSNMYDGNTIIHFVMVTSRVWKEALRRLGRA